MQQAFFHQLDKLSHEKKPNKRLGVAFALSYLSALLFSLCLCSLGLQVVFQSALSVSVSVAVSLSVSSLRILESAKRQVIQ